MDEEVPAWASARHCGGEEEAERMEEAPTGGLRLLPIRLVCADEELVILVNISTIYTTRTL
jgi:hypothetical protein